MSGVHLGPAVSSTNHWEQAPQDRNKRPAEAAFDSGRDANYHQNDDYNHIADPQMQHPGNTQMNNGNGVRDLSTRIMAHMLGLEMPGVEPSTSYFPGYEWWPRNNQGFPQPPPQVPVQSTTYSGQGSDHTLLGGVPDPSTMVTPDLDWMQSMTPTSQNQPTALNNLNLNYPYDFPQYST